jgi:hypothetical protein
MSYSQYQHQGQKKTQIVDQNFANNTLFMALSAIEALEQKYLYSGSMPKQFGMYDPVDYSDREIDVLKEQLRVKLFLVKGSLEFFKQDYGNGQYRLPQSFDENMVLERLKQFQNTFKARQDDDCYHMCEDLKRMLQGYNTNFFFEAAKFKKVTNTSQQSQQSHQENLKGMMNANNIMRDQKR